MRAKKIILAVVAISGSLSTMAQGAANLAAGLKQTSDYINDATFEVLLPQALDPVTYTVTLQSNLPAQPDTLAPCDYLIRWSTESAAGPVEGFSAYFDGNHYRFRNNRLQEYHASAAIEPFMPLGPGSQLRGGVQSTTQFVDLIPQYLGTKISEIIADTSYIYTFHPDTLVNGRRSVALDGVKRGSGYDLMAFTYVFDYDTRLPRFIEIENSPGSISEQIVTVYYDDSSAQAPVEISEAGLLEEWPQVFELYRESTFRAENLVNTPLPAFACQQLGSDARYAHHLNELMSAPTIIVVLDPDVSTTPETIAAVRTAVDMAPMDIEVVFAFNSNQTERISDIVSPLRQGETALTSANSLIRNCGITMYPTTILVDRQSKVQDVIAGHNNDLDMIVLQKTTLMTSD